MDENVAVPRLCPFSLDLDGLALFHDLAVDLVEVVLGDRRAFWRDVDVEIDVVDDVPAPGLAHVGAGVVGPILGAAGDSSTLLLAVAEGGDESGGLTLDAAAAIFEKDELGSIEPGKRPGINLIESTKTLKVLV